MILEKSLTCIAELLFDFLSYRFLKWVKNTKGIFDLQFF